MTRSCTASNSTWCAAPANRRAPWTSAVAHIEVDDVVEVPGSVRLLQLAGADRERLIAVRCDLDAEAVRHVALEVAAEPVTLQVVQADVSLGRCLDGRLAGGVVCLRVHEVDAQIAVALERNRLATALVEDLLGVLEVVRRERATEVERDPAVLRVRLRVVADVDRDKVGQR